ncbi:MAG: energy-coupling factor transporter transmembrane protein EcfT [Actinomycetota bacterium]|nr:energy-coupling factor transporter transmembrane protein EcfT [Actinomycetota bacterium]
MIQTPRLIHPGAWWLWALCLAFAAMRTTNVILLLTIAAVAGFMVSARRGRAPWAEAYRLLFGFALLSIALTLVLQIVLGTRTPGHVLVNLPSAPLPHWSGGLTLGGPITGEALLNSFDAGLRLAVLITCFGAANALAHPARLLRILPAALYEVGVAIVVALTFVPQLAESLVRVRAAQRLRGRPITGLRGLRGITVPVLEESLERAISLAASMDSRGYGRRAHQGAGIRRVTVAAVLAGFGTAIIGTYQLIDPGTNHRLGLALLVAGTGLAMAGGLVAGRRTRRTRYRPDPWRWPEWLVVGCGAVVVAVYQVKVHDSTAAGLPLEWPRLTLAPFLATLLGAVPAFATPAVPDNVAPPLRVAAMPA